MTNINTTYANLRKGAWKNLRTTLVGNISDVGTRVYGSYPLKNIELPLIVIEGGIVQTDMETKTIDQNNVKDITINITVYAKEAEKIDTYADAIDALIRADRATYKSYGLNLTDDEVMDVDQGIFVDLNDQRSHSKTMAVTFEVDR